MNSNSLKEKLKDYLFNILLSCLLLIGTFLLLSPWVKEAIIKFSINNIMNNIMNNTTAEEINYNQENAEEFSWDPAIQTPNLKTILSNISKLNRKDVLGVISISDVNILFPILNGTSTQNLLVGATTVNIGQKMGEGNYILAGHHIRDDTLLFGPLLKVEEETLIQITDKTNIYTYQVVDKKIVKETDLSILQETTIPTITLFTCNVSGIKTDKRVVIRGELVDTSSFSADNQYVNMYNVQEEERVTAHNDSLVFWLVLLICLICLLVSGMYFYKNQRKS
ncbi:hypothetical protein BTA31_20415 [Bacillus haynesii]|uniref:Class A sortase n=1 Tax=Bacillus haynesii TaxID=1925021 RepID=A0ABX3I0D9_9BACI|nr:class A sortase [Bacillus haynesii]OMI25008.1 hypothetical protein BTA31_20415 [Bacillus haynesii]